jgi:hypothetical protein
MENDYIDHHAMFSTLQLIACFSTCFPIVQMQHISINHVWLTVIYTNIFHIHHISLINMCLNYNY